MNKWHTTLIITLLAITVSSCSTLITKPYTTVSVKTSDTVNYVYKGDTIFNKLNEPLPLTFENGKSPAEFTIFNNDTTRNISIRAQKPAIYYFNVLSPFFVGFAIDGLTKKHWKYPNRIYVDLNKHGYLSYFPVDSALLAKKNRFSITPLAAIGGQHPGIELSFQRLIGTHYAVQLTYEQLLASNTYLTRDAKGFAASVEYKWYIRNTHKKRLYASLVFEHLNKTHYEFLSYGNDSFQNSFDYDPNYYKYYTGIKKKFYSLTPRIGTEYYLSNRLVLDAYFGVGIRHRNVKHLNAPPNSRFSPTNWEWIDIEYDSNKPTNSFSANLDLNIKIGWTF